MILFGALRVAGRCPLVGGLALHRVFENLAPKNGLWSVSYRWYAFCLSSGTPHVTRRMSER